jgi:hypothetical protein
MKKMLVMASDGSSHAYPEGYKAEWSKTGWLVVLDESGVRQAYFFRPAYVLWRDA